MNLFKVQGIKDRDAASPVPVIDFAEYFAGAPGALPTLAVEVRDACKNVGFSYALGHGGPGDHRSRLCGLAPVSRIAARTEAQSEARRTPTTAL
jgi:non-haem dioxygenase in morphine synthesis N-terminal